MKSEKFLPFSHKELNVVLFVSSFFKTNASKLFPFSYCAVDYCSPYWSDWNKKKGYWSKGRFCLIVQ